MQLAMNLAAGDRHAFVVQQSIQSQAACERSHTPHRLNSCREAHLQAARSCRILSNQMGNQLSAVLSFRVAILLPHSAVDACCCLRRFFSIVPNLAEAPHVAQITERHSSVAAYLVGTIAMLMAALGL